VRTIRSQRCVGHSDLLTGFTPVLQLQRFAVSGSERRRYARAVTEGRRRILVSSVHLHGEGAHEDALDASVAL
jgi:hypothetical protein